MLAPDLLLPVVHRLAKRYLSRFMSVDIVDALALILGIVFSVRRLSAQKASRDETPGVDPEQFERWRRAELSAATVLSYACFAKIILDLGLQWLVPRTGVSRQVQWPVAMVIDMAWLVVMLMGMGLRAKARRLRQALTKEALTKG